MKRTALMLNVALAVVVLTGATALGQVQVPLQPKKIPQFAQPLPLLGASGVPFTLGDAASVPGKQLVNINLCEFQTPILPPGTILAAGKAVSAPLTWVWGYQEQLPNAACDANPLLHSYLGPVVLAKRGVPTEMTFNNKLPDVALSNVQAFRTSTDLTLTWGDPLSLNTAGTPITLFDPAIDPITQWFVHPPEDNLCYLMAGLPAVWPCTDNYGGNAPNTTYAAPIPAAVHIHGGEVPAVLDGGPDAWWTPNGIYGHGYYSKGGVADAAAGKAVYTYPNGQEAAPIWFHDHILGATRLNVYAGIAGGYMITDDQLSSPDTLPAGLLPLGLDRNANATLDLATDELLIPLIIQDRMFDDAGQLYFPAVGINPEHPYWIPEFVGDTIAVNGKVWPFLDVEAKRYRFLVLNGSNARAYELGFANTTVLPKQKKRSPPPPVLVTPAIYVIGNDQGYLDAAVKIDPLAALPANKLVIMPGERYEIIVDFAGAAGQTLELTNTAAVPYPFGIPVNPLTEGRVMQFRVAAACPSLQCGAGDTSFDPALGGTIRWKLDTAAVPPAVVPDPIVRLTDPATGTVPAGVTVHKVRRLTLNEVLSAVGPLEILVNNTLYDGTSTRTYGDFTAVSTMWNTSYYSELPHEGETERWDIVNLTVDAHPMHPHLVAFQVLQRQPLDTLLYGAAYDGSFPGGVYLPGFGPPLDYNCGLGAAPGRGVLDPAACVLGGNPDPAPYFVGAATPPAPQEIGWKDTVMAPPGMVTSVLVRFARTTEPLADPATGLDNSGAIGYDFDPNGGHGYVWHCHIIDHEDNEMMRPYQVQTNASVPHNYVMGIDF